VSAAAQPFVQLHRFVDMPSTVSIEMGTNVRPVLSNLSM
jgi:hypothetical protein